MTKDTIVFDCKNTINFEMREFLGKTIYLTAQEWLKNSDFQKKSAVSAVQRVHLQRRKTLPLKVVQSDFLYVKSLECYHIWRGIGC